MKRRAFKKFYSTYHILANFAWLLKHKKLVYLTNITFLNKEQENTLKNNLEFMGLKIQHLPTKILNQQQQIDYFYAFHGNSFFLTTIGEYSFKDFLDIILPTTEENDINKWLHITHVISKGKLYASKDLQDIFKILTIIPDSENDENKFLKLINVFFVKYVFFKIHKKILQQFFLTTFIQLKKKHGYL